MWIHMFLSYVFCSQLVAILNNNTYVDLHMIVDPEDISPSILRALQIHNRQANKQIFFGLYYKKLAVIFVIHEN